MPRKGGKVVVHLQSGEALSGRLIDLSREEVVIEVGRGIVTRVSVENIGSVERNVVGQVSESEPERKSEKTSRHLLDLGALFGWAQP